MTQIVLYVRIDICHHKQSHVCATVYDVPSKEHRIQYKVHVHIHTRIRSSTLAAMLHHSNSNLKWRTCSIQMFTMSSIMVGINHQHQLNILILFGTHVGSSIWLSNWVPRYTRISCIRFCAAAHRMEQLQIVNINSTASSFYRSAWRNSEEAHHR